MALVTAGVCLGPQPIVHEDRIGSRGRQLYLITGSDGVTCKKCDSSWNIEPRTNCVASHLEKDQDYEKHYSRVLR